jgi:hypothetical protein
MPPLVVRRGIRLALRLTPAWLVKRQVAAMARRYADILRQVPVELRDRAFRVRAMTGVDEDMREWSLHMIWEHNAIVNRSITACVSQLADGVPLHGDALIDMKHGVMPDAAGGSEAESAFESSIQAHLDALSVRKSLRGTATLEHPVFGAFDAHCWHAMFPFHLRLHLAQARAVAVGVCPCA